MEYIGEKYVAKYKLICVHYFKSTHSYIKYIQIQIEVTYIM